MKLRPYQTQLIVDIETAHREGAKNVCAVMPTGSGKTQTFSAYTKRQTLPVAIMVHRTELVSQISMTLASWGVSHRLIAPSATIRSIRNEHHRAFGRTFDNPNAPHSVSSVDTLIARYDTYRSYFSTVATWIIDEAAHALRENKWGRCTELFPNARGIGFTATPKRADGKGLGAHNDGVFHTMVQGPTTGQLIQMGHLSDYRIIAKPSDIDLSDVNITATGDYSGEKLRQKSHKSHIVGDVVKEYQEHAAGKQGITFTVDVETANELAVQFNAAGVPAAAVSAQTPEAERQDAVRKFRNGELRQLTNCDLFGEGFDVPNVEVVSLARPTASLSLYLQQIGRALRPAEGKDFALIIDHVGNWERHYLPDTPRVWSLEPRTRGETRPKDVDLIPLTTCLECFKVFARKLLPTCPHCKAKRLPTNRAGPEQVDGDLTMLDPEVLAQLREAVKLPTPDDVAARVTFKAGKRAGRSAYDAQNERIKSQEALRKAIANWAGVRKARGQSDSVSHREFYLTFGEDVLTAQTHPRADMDALRERVERDTEQP